MRIRSYGRINRKAPVTFTFDGKSYEGFEGDTVASALLAHGVKFVGRSFKYHRPRGVLTAGSEEPNALIEVGTGAGQTPNTRATEQEIFTGLMARSQNRWPNLKLDVLGLNDFVAPFLGAGFYYKTFMWPKAFWKTIYEPIIRRAAGLGALSGAHDTQKNEKAFAYCDLLVVGSGPTGLMAALTAARAGADVILAEERAEFGGRLIDDQREIDGIASPLWVDHVIEELSQLPNVRLMARTTVTGAYDQGTFGALERVNHHRAVNSNEAPLECFWRIVAQKTILAAGALERPIAFENNDRPGVMMSSALRSYLNRYGVAAGQNVVLFGNNDDIYRTADELHHAGVTVVAVVDARKGEEKPHPYPVMQNAQVINTKGYFGLSAVLVREKGEDRWIEADCLGISGGWNPSLHLTCHMNGRPKWDETIAAFVPQENAVPNLTAAGAARGEFSDAACLMDGIFAAQAALAALERTAKTVECPKADDTPYTILPLWETPHEKRAWLDFQNDVTTKDVRGAAQENYRSVEHMKRFTTQGMAPDQGKNSNVNALAILADATGRTVSETGITTYRPPYVPVSISAMGAGGRGKGFAPERFMTSHMASLQRGAPMIEAGLWYRPSYFPQQGESTWREACDREVTMVRNSVGICDVSTLGKIDIQGPDAGAFLDFIYTNVFSTLPVGKTRYGLMLREDGHVMDDGTTARLGEHHYLMTTTTAAAGTVMRHLEFVHQCLMPNANVRFTSVTDQWAQFAVAGPKSRDLLNTILDKPIEEATWPFMACGEIGIGGVRGRLFRISFSGEQAYEIAVPARYGNALFRDLLARAETMDGGPYGMEALNVLRIEKGFITHSEIHGRITVADLGLSGLMSKKKDFIGKTAAGRPGLLDPMREQLVGLKPVDPEDEFGAGAYLFNVGDAAISAHSQGYVTSVGYSPTLSSYLGLGFVKNGLARHGDRLTLRDHLRGTDITVELVSPVFFDPKGGRARG
ncbi:MAG: sarcosine oxidase subunit alpha family protein [Halocynthiibacter sp.]